MKDFMSSFYEKHPRLFALIVFFVITMSFAMLRYIIWDRHDASRFVQFEFDRNMADSGEYIEESAFSHPYQTKDFYGKRMVLEVKLGSSQKERGVYWYPSAEFPNHKAHYILYSEEPYSEQEGADLMTAECLITGHYSVPTGQAIQVASGGYVLEILNLTETEAAGSSPSEP